MSRPENEKTSKAVLAVILMIPLLASCQGFKPSVYPDLTLRSANKNTTLGIPNRKTIESLLVNVWSSGFFKDTEIVREEILNNGYGIYSGESEYKELAGARAFYLQEASGKGKIMLNLSLFSRWQGGGSFSEIVRVGWSIKVTLVHELFHGFWFHLLDRQKRNLFSAEAQIFFAELSLIKTKEEKLRFLKEIGYDAPQAKHFGAFQKILELKKIYQDPLFHYELFSFIGALAYLDEMIVPIPFRNFYSGILAEDVVSRSRP